MIEIEPEELLDTNPIKTLDTKLHSLEALILKLDSARVASLTAQIARINTIDKQLNKLDKTTTDALYATITHIENIEARLDKLEAKSKNNTNE